jgi:hypothetical protein
VDLDADKVYEYMDSIPGQSKPIQYFSSYGGQGYRPFGMNSTVDDDDETVRIGTEATLRSVYNQASGNKVPPGTGTASDPVPYKENGYQLISPGFDGDYGYGGYCHGQNGCLTQDAYVDPAGRKDVIQYERDNITNFKGGRLN